MEKISKDRRVRRTKKNLLESMLALMQQKELAKITVKELCETADINRSTFYQYYENIDDMIYQIQSELFDKFRIYLGQNFFNNIFDNVLAVTRYLKENSVSVHIIVNASPNSRRELRAVLEEIITGNIDEWRKYYTLKEEAQTRYLLTFIINGSESLIMDWIEEGFQETPDYIADLTIALSRRALNAGHSSNVE